MLQGQIPAHRALRPPLHLLALPVAPGQCFARNQYVFTARESARRVAGVQVVRRGCRVGLDGTAATGNRKRNQQRRSEAGGSRPLLESKTWSRQSKTGSRQSKTGSRQGKARLAPGKAKQDWLQARQGRQGREIAMAPVAMSRLCEGRVARSGMLAQPDEPAGTRLRYSGTAERCWRGARRARRHHPLFRRRCEHSFPCDPNGPVARKAARDSVHVREMSSRPGDDDLRTQRRGNGAAAHDTPGTSSRSKAPARFQPVCKSQLRGALTGGVHLPLARAHFERASLAPNASSCGRLKPPNHGAEEHGSTNPAASSWRRGS